MALGPGHGERGRGKQELCLDKVEAEKLEFC